MDETTLLYNRLGRCFRMDPAQWARALHLAAGPDIETGNGKLVPAREAKRLWSGLTSADPGGDPEMAALSEFLAGCIPGGFLIAGAAAADDPASTALDLHALNAVHDRQGQPAVMDLAPVGQ